MNKIFGLIGLLVLTNCFTHAQSDSTWMDLDGTNDYLDLGTDSILAGKTKFTVEMRMHFDNSAGDYTLLGQRTTDLNRTIVLQRWAGAFNILFSEYNYAYCAFEPCPAEAYHIAIVYDGAADSTSRVKLYVNGISQALTIIGTIPTSTLVTSPPANLVIGCEHNDSLDQLQWVNGQIGEFCIWDYPLTPLEIGGRIATEVVGSEPGLLEYFHFDNGIPGGNNTSITSFAGGIGVSTITPVNMTMDGASSNLVGSPSMVSPIDTSVTVTGLVLTSNTAGATYQWLDCNSGFAAIPGATNQNYTASAIGSYAVQITSGSCIDTSACVEITSVDVPNPQMADIAVYPNPAQDEIVLKVAGMTGPMMYEIQNPAGQVLETGHCFDGKSINTTELSSGLYFLKVTSKNESATKKFVKL